MKHFALISCKYFKDRKNIVNVKTGASEHFGFSSGFVLFDNLTYVYSKSKFLLIVVRVGTSILLKVRGTESLKVVETT